MNLVQLALTTYTEGTAIQAEAAPELAEQARNQFLQYARSHAEHTLSQAARDLVWQYVTVGLPDEVEEARAVLAAGRPDYLRYRHNHADPDGEVAFDLVQPCFTCGTDRVSPVRGLFHLGELLHEEPHPAPEPAAEGEPGPLAAVEALSAHTADVSGLVRRLMDRFPDAGLTVSNVVCIAWARGNGSITVDAEAASMNAVREVAAGLGAEVTTSHSDIPGPYGGVIEHATAKGSLGADVEISLHGCTRLTDDEAEAWRAQQTQPAEVEVGTAGGAR
ncbi:hypothetical protein ACKI1U_08260 [Streptomyces scabiei]